MESMDCLPSPAENSNSTETVEIKQNDDLVLKSFRMQDLPIWTELQSYKHISEAKKSRLCVVFCDLLKKMWSDINLNSINDDLLILTGKDDKGDGLDAVIPISFTQQLSPIMLSEMIQLLKPYSYKSICLAIVSDDSSTIYMNISDEIGRPESEEEDKVWIKNQQKQARFQLNKYCESLARGSND